MNKKFSLIIGISLLLLAACEGNKKSENNHLTDGNSQWKMGVALYSFRPSSFAQSLNKAKKAGVKYVAGYSFQKLGEKFGGRPLLELSDKQLKKMKKMLQDKGLKMASLYVGAKTKSEWEEYFKVGHTLGLEYLVGEPKRKRLDFIDSLAGSYDMRLAIHGHAKGESMYWHPDSVLAALQGRPNLGACVDIGHWVRSGLDPVKGLKALAGNIISLHVKNIDEAGNVNANYVDLDQGVIDYKVVAKQLQQQGFSGIVYIEDERSGTNLDEVKSAVSYLRNLKGK